MTTEQKLDDATIEAAIRAEVGHVRRVEEPEAARWPDDYEADEVAAMRGRVRAVIAAYFAAAPAAPAQKPVAYRWRMAKSWAWHYSEDLPLANDGIEIQPVYAAPPAPVADSAVDVLRDALHEALTWHQSEDKALSKSGRTDNEYHWRRAQHGEQQDLINEALAASPSSPNPVADNPAGDPVVNAPMVLELEWTDLGNGTSFRALLPIIGSVRVEPYGCCGWWEVLWSMPGMCDKLIPDVFDNPEDAKAAAQSDYERRVRACLVDAPVAAGWQTMESAPKDGTLVDLWHDEMGRMADYYWGVPQHCCGEAGGNCDSEWHGLEPGWVDSALNEPIGSEGFTHWMPLPAAPGEG